MRGEIWRIAARDRSPPARGMDPAVGAEEQAAAPAAPAATAPQRRLRIGAPSLRAEPELTQCTGTKSYLSSTCRGHLPTPLRVWTPTRRASTSFLAR